MPLLTHGSADVSSLSDDSDYDSNSDRPSVRKSPISDTEVFTVGFLKAMSAESLRRLARSASGRLARNPPSNSHSNLPEQVVVSGKAPYFFCSELTEHVARLLTDSPPVMKAELISYYQPRKEGSSDIMEAALVCRRSLKWTKGFACEVNTGDEQGLKDWAREMNLKVIEDGRIKLTATGEDTLKPAQRGKIFIKGVSESRLRLRRTLESLGMPASKLWQSGDLGNIGD
ncbi:hypothetical protein B0H67DRAFT_641392 [Lasiosphaeris hirsuta]|uniref:Uncharacterized protein n=1 Tax=Lasiosphaeris hirsuta TaxID=260670 RepID=A0AA40E4N1_9PEZI|nr:hypothetical protein B0H67DRAFT_641392 [Lasiosphaeris hirsuta]